MRIDVAGFLGSNRQINRTLLPDGVGVDSVNQAPGRGDMRPWKAPLTVATVPVSPVRKTIYRMGRDTDSDTNYWLSWSTVVHAVRGFDREDSQERTYYTGDGVPKWTDNTMALATSPYPTASRLLGVPAPTGAPVLAISTAGTGTDGSRYYVTTFVNDLGWESAPSPVARIDCKSDARITLSSLENAPAGAYGINRRRIYRTETGATGATEFFFLYEMAYASGGQSWTEDGRALSTDVLKTQGDSPLGAWLPCPSDAKWLTQLWNQMAVVISGKSIRPCVAGTIYAYPYEYELLIADQPVALGVWGQNLLVLTTGTPSVITGQDPASLSEQPLDGIPFNASCSSELSVVSLGQGVAWAGPDGLCYLGNGGSRVLTSGLIHPEQWKAMNPQTMVASQYYGMYVCSYWDGSAWRGFMIDPGNPTGVFWLDTGYPVMFFDKRTSALFVLDGGNVRKWNAGASFMTASFTSKAYRTPSANMGYGRVIADAYPVTLILRGDDVVKCTKTVTDDNVFSLPGGYEAQLWQLTIETQGGAVVSAHIAETDEELFP